MFFKFVLHQIPMSSELYEMSSDFTFRALEVNFFCICLISKWTKERSLQGCMIAWYQLCSSRQTNFFFKVLCKDSKYWGVCKAAWLHDSNCVEFANGGFWCKVLCTDSKPWVWFQNDRVKVQKERSLQKHPLATWTQLLSCNHAALQTPLLLNFYSIVLNSGLLGIWA